MGEEHGTWSCRFEIGEPLDVERKIYGVSSLQALTLAVKTLSTYLYGSDLYKNGELGAHGSSVAAFPFRRHRQCSTRLRFPSDRRYLFMAETTRPPTAPTARPSGQLGSSA
jgi:hypothetical protein